MASSPTEPARERSLSELFTSLSGELSTLFRQEIALAKAELRGEAAKAGQAAGMLAAAGVFGLIALLILVTAVALGLAAALDNDWLAFLIVGVVLLVVAAVLALSGRKRLQAIGPPQRTIETLRDDAQTIKERRP